LNINTSIIIDNNNHSSNSIKNSNKKWQVN